MESMRVMCKGESFALYFRESIITNFQYTMSMDDVKFSPPYLFLFFGLKFLNINGKILDDL